MRDDQEQIEESSEDFSLEILGREKSGRLGRERRKRKNGRSRATREDRREKDGGVRRIVKRFSKAS